MRRKNGKREEQSNCFKCALCLYIGETDFLCEAENKIVLTDFNEPTEEFYCCKGKEFVQDEN